MTIRLMLSQAIMQSIVSRLELDMPAHSEFVERHEVKTEADLSGAPPRFALLIAVWLISTAALAAAIAEGNHYGDLRILAKTGVMSSGRVEVLEPSNHDRLVYSYEVAGVMYHGYSHIGEHNISVGDTLPVFYSSETPSLSTLGDPSRSATGTLILAIVIGAVVSALIVFALERRGLFGRR